MVHYDVMIDNDGNYVQMDIDDIVATGSETVCIRSSHGKNLVVRVETLLEIHRHETKLRRDKQFRRERRDPELREYREEEDRREKEHPLPTKFIGPENYDPRKHNLTAIEKQYYKQSLNRNADPVKDEESSDEKVITINVDSPSESE